MYYDLEDLKALAGVNQPTGTGTTHLDEINPRKLAGLTESIRRADYDVGLNMIYNWIKAGNIDTMQFKDLLKVNEAKLDES
jgi:hypothetical protein